MAARLVASGLTFLRRANSATEALYYEAFFGITIGLERISKLTIVVSEYVHKGSFPTDKDLKQNFGHDLADLIGEVRKRASQGLISTQWPVPIGPEADDTIAFLTDFAKFNRYYNLSFLGGAGPKSEPIEAWVDLVLKFHPQPPSSPAQAKNYEAMQKLNDLIGHAFLIRQVDEHGQPINDLMAGASHATVTEHIQKQGTMMCARLARSLAGTLASLSYGSHSSGDVLPVFGEFFGVLLNDDAYLAGRRTFNSPR